jgi:23S rRNA (uracil1939-C5)-methyltransferase
MSLEVTIEKLIYGGDGLARLPADEHGRGKALFVPFVLEGERALVDLDEEKPGFARGRVAQVLAASERRVEPPCPYFYRCGGCHYQHASYEEQLRIKVEILRETLRRTAKLEWQGEIAAHASPPWEYRNRTRMRVRTEPEFQLGYNRFGSSELLAVEKCPISSPLIHRAIAAVWELGRAGEVPPGVAEVEFFADHDDSRLLLELYVRDSRARESETLFTRMKSAMPQAVGAAAFPAGRPDAEPLATFGEPHLDYVAGGNTYRVSAGSFFQTNRYLLDILLQLVTTNESGESALDLYAGVGLFTVPLAHRFRKVKAVEMASQSFPDLQHNLPANAKAARAMAQTYLSQRQGPRPGLVIADPPRSGLGDAVTRALAELAAPRLTYVSCDPSTLARDLQRLLASGYKVKDLALIDLFPQTFHFETVVKLMR